VGLATVARHGLTMLPRLTAFVVFASLALGPAAAAAQQAAERSGGLRVFLDCSGCPTRRIYQEITFVNWVRYATAADVHVLVTQTAAGGGGAEYTFNYIGRNALAGRGDTLRYVSSRTDTEDALASGLVQTFKLGLVRYAASTPLGSQIRVSYEPPADSSPSAAVPVSTRDPWNYWVFSASVTGSVSGEQQFNGVSFGGSLSAARTTEALKLAFSAQADYNRSKYQLSPTSEFVSSKSNFGGSALSVWSVGRHWSAGLDGRIASQSYYNEDVVLQGGPALEYSIFPYADISRRQLTLLYSVGPEAAYYTEGTIFGKKKELLMVHKLNVALALRQPWGSMSTSLGAAQYMHDLSKHHVMLSCNLNLRVTQGIGLTVGATISRIKDQLYLPRTGLTQEQILTRQSQLGTDYSYRTSIGLSYTFGSVLSNVVNPRLGGML
jgi:hypothetical protein